MSERISVDFTALKKVKLLHRGRNITKANIYEYLYHGQRVILKDYKDRNFFIKSTIGRWFISREFRIYKILNGISGIHQAIGQTDPFSLLLDYLDGEPLSERPPESLSPSVFDSLKTIIQKIHQRDVACGDIHRRDILITDSGDIFLLDFATGWQKGHRFNIFSHFIFKKFLSLDWHAFYRMREWYTGLAPSQEEEKMFKDILKYYRLGRTIKSLYYYLIGKNP